MIVVPGASDLHCKTLPMLMGMKVVCRLF